MNPSPQPTRPRQARLLATDWWRMTEAAQDQALEIARYEGRRAARWYLTTVAEEQREATAVGTGEAVGGGAEDRLVSPSPAHPVSSLRGSRWAQELGNLDQLDEQILHLYAGARPLPCEIDYFTYIVEPYCPERIAWWWRIPRSERLHDPRVCAFCDGYERERRCILGLPEPPTDIAGLQRYVRDAQQRERLSARDWLSQTAASAAEEAHAEAARWEHLRRLLTAELAQMLLDAALWEAARR